MAGALLGLVSGGALAFAGGKYREKLQREEQSRQFTAQTLMQGLENNPKEWANPETQKQFKKHFGEESYNALKTHFDMALGKAQRDEQAFHAQVGQLIMGMGGKMPAPPPVPAPTSGMLANQSAGFQALTGPQDVTPAATPASTPAPGPRPAASLEQGPPEDPVAPLDFSKQIDMLRQHQMTVAENPDLSDEHKKALSDQFDKVIKDKFEEWKAAASTKEEKAAVAAAETTAREHAKLAPDITAGREAAAGRMATSRARASLSVAGSPEAMDVLKRKHDITAGGKTGSAETERKKRIDVVTALGNQYDKEHPIARLSPLGSGDARKKYIRDALGGIDPEAYLQGEGSADPSTDPATSVADKYFPKK